MHSLHYKLSWLKCSLNVIGQINVLGKWIAFLLKTEKQSVLARRFLGTNVVGTNVYRTAFSVILSSGGLLHSDWLPPNRVINLCHKVDLISTLLDALFAQKHAVLTELATGSNWKWITSGHFDALATCGVNAQLGFSFFFSGSNPLSSCLCTGQILIGVAISITHISTGMTIDCRPFSKLTDINSRFFTSLFSSLCALIALWNQLAFSKCRQDPVLSLFDSTIIIIVCCIWVFLMVSDKLSRAQTGRYLSALSP